MSRIIATIDFEASSLSLQGEPIEVGVALWQRGGPIRTWSSLICPVEDNLWSPESEAVHHISRHELSYAPHPARVAERLNSIMAGVREAFCDGGSFDERWMAQFYLAAGIRPVFELSSIYAMLELYDSAVDGERIRSLEGFLKTTVPPHRAGPDAVRLMRAYAYALGEEPCVEDLQASSAAPRA